MSKHTPGPWMVTNGIDIWPDDGDMRGLRHIAMCHPLHGYPELEDHLEWDERIANARLIAAAPELLEACEAAMRIETLWCDSSFNPSNCMGNEEGYALHLMREKLRAAIAKATGAAP